MTTDRSYRWLFWILALVGLAADQVSKYGMFRWLDDGITYEGEKDVVPGVFKFYVRFQHYELAPKLGSWHQLQTLTHPRTPTVNEGALFGMGGQYKHVANGTFAVVSILAAVGIMLWSTSNTLAKDGLLCVALGLILAGTLGNLYDRLIFGGVRDFLYFYLINWPVFNVADCCLVVGAVLMVLQTMWATNPEEALAAQANTSAHATNDNIPALATSNVAEYSATHQV